MFRADPEVVPNSMVSKSNDPKHSVGVTVQPRVSSDEKQLQLEVTKVRCAPVSSVTDHFDGFKVLF